jgi:hypothetical protein
LKILRRDENIDRYDSQSENQLKRPRLGHSFDFQYATILNSGINFTLLDIDSNIVVDVSKNLIRISGFTFEQWQRGDNLSYMTYDSNSFLLKVIIFFVELVFL